MDSCGEWEEEELDRLLTRPPDKTCWESWRGGILCCIGLLICVVAISFISMPVSRVVTLKTTAVVKGWVHKRPGTLDLPRVSCLTPHEESFNATQWMEYCKAVTQGCPIPDPGEACSPTSTGWLMWLEQLNNVTDSHNSTYGLLGWEEGKLKVWDFTVDVQPVECITKIYHFGVLTVWGEYITGFDKVSDCMIFRLLAFPNGTAAGNDSWAMEGGSLPPMSQLIAPQDADTAVTPHLRRQTRAAKEQTKGHRLPSPQSIWLDRTKAFSAYKMIPLGKGKQLLPMTLHVTPKGVKLNFIHAPHVLNRSLIDGMTEYFMIIPRLAWDKGEADSVWRCIKKLTSDPKYPRTWWNNYIWKLMSLGGHVRGPFPGMIPKTSHDAWLVNSTSKRWALNVSYEMWTEDVHGLMGHFAPNGFDKPGRVTEYDVLFGQWWATNLTEGVLECRPKERLGSTIFWMANLLALLNPATVPTIKDVNVKKGVNMTPPFVRMEKHGSLIELTMVRSQGPHLDDLYSTPAYSKFRFMNMTWGHYTGELRDLEYDYAYREQALRFREAHWVRNSLLTRWCRSDACFRTLAQPATKIAVRNGKNVYNPYELGGFVDPHGYPHWWHSNWSSYVVWDSENFPSLGVGWGYFANSKGPKACFCQEDIDAVEYRSDLGIWPFQAWIPIGGGRWEQNCSGSFHFPNRTGTCWLSERARMSDWEFVQKGFKIIGQGLTLGIREAVKVVAQGAMGVASLIISELWVYAKVPVIVGGVLVMLSVCVKLMHLLKCFASCSRRSANQPRWQEEGPPESIRLGPRGRRALRNRAVRR
nr:uncharacterized protein LOC129155901 [Nothobranchius furzeri]